MWNSTIPACIFSGLAKNVFSTLQCFSLFHKHITFFREQCISGRNLYLSTHFQKRHIDNNPGCSHSFCQNVQLMKTNSTSVFLPPKTRETGLSSGPRAHIHMELNKAAGNCWSDHCGDDSQHFYCFSLKSFNRFLFLCPHNDVRVYYRAEFIVYFLNSNPGGFSEHTVPSLFTPSRLFHILSH